MKIVDLLINKEIKQADSIYKTISKLNGVMDCIVPLKNDEEIRVETFAENHGIPIELRLPFNLPITEIIQTIELNFRDLWINVFTKEMDDLAKDQFLKIYTYNLAIPTAKLFSKCIPEIAHHLEDLGWVRARNEYKDWMSKTEDLSLKPNIPDSIYQTAKSAVDAFQYLKSRAPFSNRYRNPIIFSNFAGAGVWERYFLAQSCLQSEISPIVISTDQNILSCIRAGLNVLLQNIFLPENKRIKVFIVDGPDISEKLINDLSVYADGHPILILRRCDFISGARADLNHNLQGNLLNFDNSLVYLSQPVIENYLICFGEMIARRNRENGDLFIQYIGLELTIVKIFRWVLTSQLRDSQLINHYEAAVKNISSYNGYKAIIFCNLEKLVRTNSGEYKRYKIITQLRSPYIARLYNIFRNAAHDMEAFRIFIALLQVTSRLSDLSLDIITETHQHHEWFINKIRDLNCNIHIDEILCPGSNQVDSDGTQLQRIGVIRLFAE